jgi:hypothetical protein
MSFTQAFTLRRKTRVTHLESLSLSSAFFIPMGGPQAHAKLRTPVNERYRDFSPIDRFPLMPDRDLSGKVSHQQAAIRQN